MARRKLGQELMARVGLASPTRAAEAPEEMPAADRADPATDERFRRLEARIGHLEATLEGLQDSVYRETQRIDESLAELREKTEPENMSRALSADARRRGL